MRHPELPVVSFLCVPLLFCSLPSHIRAGSVATIALIAWLAVVSVIRGVNALVWANNFDVKLEVWCDITTKITIGFTYAVPASALCILRHLESVASSRNVRTSKSDKRRRQRFEAVMCFGLPMIGMALHYVVQGHRLDLIEDFGCYPPVYFSVAAIMILWVPPFVMSLTTFVYAALSLRHFLKHRIEFAAHLRNSQSAITPARYFRLMAMAVIEMIWDSGVNAYLIYFNTFTGILPWTTWDDVHSNFSRVAIFPMALIPPVFVTQLIWQWWIVPISCIFFFIFFGFGEEAMADYRVAFNWFRRTILRQDVTKRPAFGANTLPTHHPRSQNSYDVDITPAVSDGSSEHDPKAWDELSLKMPHIVEHVELPNGGAAPATVHRDTSLADSSHSMTSIHLDEKRRSVSIHTLDSSFSTAAGPSTPPSPTHGPVGSVPTLTVTASSPNRTSFPNPPSTDRTRTPQPATHNEASLTPSHHPGPGDRRSMSSDNEITISPAYFPDEVSTSPYDNETFYVSEATGVRPSVPRSAAVRAHGGVRILVERSIV